MLDIDYLVDRIKKVKSMLNKYVDHDLNMIQKIIVVIDLAFSIIIYGVGITDYFQYKFYKRRHVDRKDFIVYRKRMWLVRTLNNQEDRKIFDNKAHFNTVFNAFLHREWLNLSGSTFTEFEKFLAETKIFLIKPNQGSHGLGIKILYSNKISNPKKLFLDLKAEHCILEELIDQNDELAEFNPSSVNTMRVVSLIGPDKIVRLMTANLRIGYGNRYVDNFHYQGIAALIDMETGLLITEGIDKNLRKYINHPVTGKQIIGFKMPFWNNIKETVLQAAQVVPTVRYVGWDIAVGKQGEVILVEGNAAADPDLSQIPDQIGKWPLFKKVLEAH